MDDVRTTFDLAPPMTFIAIVACALVALLLFALMRWLFGPPTKNARRWGLLVIRGLLLAAVVAILANPVRVDRRPGEIERPKVFYLLDASQSMSLGRETRRWDDALATIARAGQLVPEKSKPDLSVFRFGRRLSAVEWSDVLESVSAPSGDRASPAPSARHAPTDSDTQLVSALRQLPGRFGASAPRMMVVFSDGQVRDPAGVAEIAPRYTRMGIPIHVLACGDPQGAGDVAIESLVAPEVVRKHSRVGVQVYVRSFGYEGKRSELRLSAIDREGNVQRQLERLPITLRSGVQPFSLSFQSEVHPLSIRASIEPQPDEISKANNALSTDIYVDRTKIRVLYVVSSLEQIVTGGRTEGSGPYRSGTRTSLQQALSEDEDIECVLTMPARIAGGPAQIRLQPVSGNVQVGSAGIRLFAFDAIVLSDVARETLSEELIARFERFVAHRGGGFCMVGGPRSFASGDWQGSLIESLLPLELAGDDRDWLSAAVSVRPVFSNAAHPIWNIVTDERQNRALLDELPPCDGINRLGPPKPGATILATAAPGGASETLPVIAAQPFGRGRTMAVATAMTERWGRGGGRKWGDGSGQYYNKFWRNVVYWLTENSEIGRRRLLVKADKRLYRPGEPIQLRAESFDEGGTQTTKYRVVLTVEPATFSENISEWNSPMLWPQGHTPEDPELGRFVPWGEELAMAVRGDGRSYEAVLPTGEAEELLEIGAAPVHALRIEATAYEDFTQVDSTSVDIQILNDPDEMQTPLPNHLVLQKLADITGGEFLLDADALAAQIRDLPFHQGPPVVTRVPVWSKSWLLILLLAALTSEWAWRRLIGLA
jgi:uncharacterized membrane protein